MKTLIENLCGKLESWGIDPLTLLKAIGVLIVLALVLLLLFIVPDLFIILLVTLLCIVIIGLIYSMIEFCEKG